MDSKKTPRPALLPSPSIPPSAPARPGRDGGFSTDRLVGGMGRGTFQPEQPDILGYRRNGSDPFDFGRGERGFRDGERGFREHDRGDPRMDVERESFRGSQRPRETGGWRSEPIETERNGSRPFPFSAGEHSDNINLMKENVAFKNY